MGDTLMRSPNLGSADSMSTITGAMEGVLLGCSDIEIENNSVEKIKFTLYRYRLSDGKGYCEIHQKISQILKYPVTTRISQGITDGATLWSKSTGDEMPCPFWNPEPGTHQHIA